MFTVIHEINKLKCQTKFKELENHVILKTDDPLLICA